MRFGSWWRRGSRLDNIEHDVIWDKIVWVAMAAKDTPVFRERARTAAGEMGPGVISVLPRYLSGKLSPPAELKSEFPGFGGWFHAVQYAVFEILYNFKETALPLLRKAAYGQRTGMPSLAVAVLCRLGAEGIERAKIGEELASHLRKWRYETTIAVVGRLAELAVYSPPLMDALHKLADDWMEDDPIDALEVIEPLVHYSPDQVWRYESFLRSIMREIGRDVPADRVVQKEEEDGTVTVAAFSGPTYPSIQDYHAIHTALTLHDAIPEDEEALSELRKWVVHHPDESVRQELAERLEQKPS